MGGPFCRFQARNDHGGYHALMCQQANVTLAPLRKVFPRLIDFGHLIIWIMEVPWKCIVTCTVSYTTDNMEIVGHSNTNPSVSFFLRFILWSVTQDVLVSCGH